MSVVRCDDVAPAPACGVSAWQSFARSRRSLAQRPAKPCWCALCQQQRRSDAHFPTLNSLVCSSQTQTVESIEELAPDSIAHPGRSVCVCVCMCSSFTTIGAALRVAVQEATRTYCKCADRARYSRRRLSVCVCVWPRSSIGTVGCQLDRAGRRHAPSDRSAGEKQTHPLAFVVSSFFFFWSPKIDEDDSYVRSFPRKLGYIDLTTLVYLEKVSACLSALVGDSSRWLRRARNPARRGNLIVCGRCRIFDRRLFCADR